MTTATSVSIIRSLFAHAAWANSTVISGIRSTPGSDAHALEQLAHVLAAERVWLTRILGQPQTIAVWPALSVDQCEALARENERSFASLIDDATETSLERDVTYTNSAGRTFTNRMLDILLHVAMHGAYHRGMTSILTRRSGGTPAPTDFIAFLRGAPTATRADAEGAR
ncbi:MAG: DinB family protein [Gemmatimonadaceae bacterium]